MTKLANINHEKHELDAKDQVLGRLATRVATLLMGKNKPYFVRYLDCGDFVKISNAAKIIITGKKAMTKKYTRYSGYPAGLKIISLKKLRAEKPEEVIRRAVVGMLPDNKLKKFWTARLSVYA